MIDFETTLPATANQQWIWFHQQLAPQDVFYQIPMVLSIVGNIKRPKLEKVINYIRYQQPSLRCSFSEKDGRLWQQIYCYKPQPLAYTDLSSLQSRAQKMAIVLSCRLARQPMNLDKEDLFRVHLYRLSDNQYILTNIMHHIISDGWSWQCYFNSLFRYYSEISADKLLDEQKIVAAIRRSQLEKDEEMRQLNFYQENLYKMPILRLLNSSIRLPYQQFGGEQYRTDISEELAIIVDTTSRQNGLTPPMFYLAAFQLTLHYISGQNDFGIGIPTAERGEQSIMNSIGCFINTLVYRAKLSTQFSIIEYLTAVRDQALDSLSHDKVALSHLIDKIDCEHKQGFNPLFQVMFIFQDMQFYQDWQCDGGFTVNYLPLDIGTTVFELTFEIRPTTAGTYYCLVTYRRDLYTKAFITCFCQIFQYLLLQLTRNQNVLITDYFHHLDKQFGAVLNNFGKDVNPIIEDKPSNVAPTTALEHRLCQLWRQILATDIDSVNTHFFHYGGNSLLALKLLSRINHDFNVKLTFREFFAHATIAELAKILTDNNRGVLTKNDSLAVSRIEALPQQQFYVASYAQEQLWFLAALNDKSSAYNVSGLLTINGYIDYALIQQILILLIERHCSLRTTFEYQRGICRQRINDSMVLKLDYEYLAHEINSDQINDFCRPLAQRSFDLQHGPLFRFKCFHSNDNKTYLFIAMHHIIFDGWSFDIFLNDFKMYYRQLANNEQSNIKPLAIQYGDYAQWQRQNYQKLFDDKLAFWRQYLKNIKPLTLPLDKVRPRVQRNQGAKVKKMLSVELTSQLRSAASSCELTLLQLLLSAYFIVLHALGNETSFAVAVPYAGRESIELENIVGLFATNVIICVDINSSMSFAQVFSEVRKNTLVALEHGGVPFELLVKDINQKRDTSRNPLVQAAFNLVNMFDPNFKLTDDLTASITTLDSGGSKYDLSLMIIDCGQTLSCELEYDKHLFFPESVTAFLDYFENILMQIDEQPEKKLYQLDWSKYSKQLPQQTIDNKHVSIIDAFSHQVKQQPTKIAVVSENRAITYEQLDQLSERLKNKLLALDTRQLRRIALIAAHDCSMIIGILAILKSGAGYIPINSDAPQQWIENVVTTCQAEAILLLDTLSYSINIPTTPMMLDDSKQGRQWLVALTDHKVCTEDQHLAYVLFTSGSSGRSKAVAQSHQNTLTHIYNYITQLKLVEDDRLLQVASFSHDASVMDIFSSLIVGSTIYCASLKKNSLYEIHQLIENQHLTILHMTPSIFRVIGTNNGNKTIFQSVKKIILGGEVVDKLVIDIFKKNFSENCVLYNLYGASEYSFSFLNPISTSIKVKRQSAPVGLPLIDAKIKLVDDQGYEHPLYGELVYQGEAVALNQNRSQHQQQIQGFYSGDIMRLLPNGKYIFVERKDFQIKIRGQRVDLQKVQLILQAEKKVKNAVVCYQKKTNGDTILIAFVIAINKAVVNGLKKALQECLRRQLPDYMVPTHIFIIDEIPYNSHGKVDYGVLRQFRIKDTSVIASGQLNGGEERLKTLWEKMLAITIVDIDATFFELGGHSLLLIELQEQIRKVFLMEIELVDFFSYSTIRTLAAFIAEKRNGNCISDVTITDKSDVCSRQHNRQKVIRQRKISKETV